MPDSSSTEQELNDKIAYAKQLHATAVANMDEAEQVYKGEYATSKDQPPSETQVSAYKPSRPRAIVAKMLALLSVRAKMQNQVPPRKDTQQEEAICTKLEQFLEGYQATVTAIRANEAVMSGQRITIPKNLYELA